MTARQFHKCVLALTSAPWQQQAELSEDQTQSWPWAAPVKSLWVQKQHSLLSLCHGYWACIRLCFFLKISVLSAVTFLCSHPKSQLVTPASGSPTLKFPFQSPFMFYILMCHVHLLPFSSIWALPLIVNCINQLTKELLQSFSLPSVLCSLLNICFVIWVASEAMSNNIPVFSLVNCKVNALNLQEIFFQEENKFGFKPSSFKTLF